MEALVSLLNSIADELSRRVRLKRIEESFKEKFGLDPAEVEIDPDTGRYCAKRLVIPEGEAGEAALNIVNIFTDADHISEITLIAKEKAFGAPDVYWNFLASENYISLDYRSTLVEYRIIISWGGNS